MLLNELFVLLPRLWWCQTFDTYQVLWLWGNFLLLIFSGFSGDIRIGEVFSTNRETSFKLTSRPKAKISWQGVGNDWTLVLLKLYERVLHIEHHQREESYVNNTQIFWGKTNPFAVNDSETLFWFMDKEFLASSWINTLLSRVCSTFSFSLKMTPQSWQAN